MGGVPYSSMFVVSHVDPARSVSAVCGWGSMLLHVCCVSQLLYTARSVSSVSGWVGSMFLHVCCVSQLLYTARSVSSVSGWVGSMFLHVCCVSQLLYTARSVSSVSGWVGSMLLYVCCVSCGPSQISEPSLWVWPHSFIVVLSQNSCTQPYVCNR